MVGPRACDLFEASLARLSLAVFPAATLSLSTTNTKLDSQSSREQFVPLVIVSFSLKLLGSSKVSQEPVLPRRSFVTFFKITYS